MRFLVISFTVILLAVSCLPAFAADPNQLYLDGLSYFQEGKFSPAEKKFLEALSKNNKHLSSLFMMGETLSKDIRRLREAEGWYRKALRDGEKDRNYATKTRFSLGTLYIQLGLYEEALKQFQYLASQWPDWYDIAKVYNQMGVARSRLDQYDEALDCFKKALKKDPAVLEATFNMKTLQSQLSRVNIARYYERMGDEGAALEQYNKAIEAYPNYIAAWYNLGLLELRKKDYQKAVRHLTRARALNPQYMGGHEITYQLARAHEARGNTGDPEQAVKLYKKYPAYKDSALRAGMVLAGQGRLDDAQAELTAAVSALEDRKFKAEAAWQLGRVFEMKKEKDRAAELFQQASELMPEEQKYRR